MAPNSGRALQPVEIVLGGRSWNLGSCSHPEAEAMARDLALLVYHHFTSVGAGGSGGAAAAADAGAGDGRGSPPVQLLMNLHNSEDTYAEVGAELS